MELAPWPIHLIDARGAALAPNPAFAAALGYSVEDFDGRTFRRSIPSQTRRLLADCRHRLHEPPLDPYLEVDLVYHHRDGTELRSPRSRIGPLDDPDAPAAVMLTTLEPPTELRRSDVQSRFAALVVHDLNNAFTIAQSYVDLARRQSPTARLSADYLERAARAIRRAIRLGEHLQIIANPRHLPIDQISFEDVLGDLRPFISRLLSPGPQWSVLCQQQLPLLMTNPVRLSRFLLDFCLNAHLRWPHSPELTLDVRSAANSHTAILARITPPSDIAPALSVPYRPLLSRPERMETDHSPQPLFLHDVLHRHPISLDIADDGITALLPGV